MTRCLSSEQLSAYVDGMAEPGEAGHVAGCARCTEAAESMRGLGAALRRVPLATERAPASLAATLRGLAATSHRRPRRPRRLGIAASVGVAVAAAAALVLAPSRSGVSTALANEAVSQHLRSFARGKPWQFASSDPRILQEWLSGRLARDVHVPPSDGAEPLGARRCSLFGEEAGAVVYRAGQTSVTAFYPAPGSTAARACESALGRCAPARDGQTVCIVPDDEGAARVVVGELPPHELFRVAGAPIPGNS